MEQKQQCPQLSFYFFVFHSFPFRQKKPNRQNLTQLIAISDKTCLFLFHSFFLIHRRAYISSENLKEKYIQKSKNKMENWILVVTYFLKSLFLALFFCGTYIAIIIFFIRVAQSPFLSTHFLIVLQSVLCYVALACLLLLDMSFSLHFPFFGDDGFRI